MAIGVPHLAVAHMQRVAGCAHLIAIGPVFAHDSALDFGPG
jgi:hypothetical protein